MAACSGDGPAGADPVARIELGPDTAYVPVNTSRQLSASAYSAGREALTGVPFTWTSSDTAVATVSGDGLVTGRAYGTARVRAAADGVSTEVTVWVTGTPGAHVRSGAGATDTIDALLPDPLVVEVRDSLGRPRAGQDVQFVGFGGSAGQGMLIGVPGTDRFELVVGVRTDAQGTASVRVRMGTGAGPAAVRFVLLGEPNATPQSAAYTVLPGAPARMQLAPRDTAVFAGRTLALRPAVADRAGNPTTAAVAYEVRRGPASVNAQTGLVTTSAYGTVWVLGRMGAAMDSVRVGSVPEGALAAGTTFDGLVVMNFDGTARRTIAPSGGGVRPAWSPAGDRLVFQSNSLDATLLTVSLNGTPAPLPGTPASRWHQWAQYSRDGQWIYFFTAAPGEPQGLWRIHPDGTGLERISAAGLEGHPSPSPDGTRIAFYEEAGADIYVRVRTLATGQVGPRLARGHTPTWSPTADLIAFSVPELGAAGNIPGGIMVVRPDGTGLRRVSQPGMNYSYSPRWSPDGRWIIASNYDRVHLIEVETGMIIELPFLESVLSADWRPGGPLP